MYIQYIRRYQKNKIKYTYHFIPYTLMTMWITFYVQNKSLTLKYTECHNRDVSKELQVRRKA